MIYKKRSDDEHGPWNMDIIYLFILGNHLNELAINYILYWTERSLCECKVQFALVLLNSTAHLNSSSALTSLATLTLKWLLPPPPPPHIIWSRARDWQYSHMQTVLLIIPQIALLVSKHVSFMFLLKRDNLTPRDIHSQPFAWIYSMFCMLLMS